jgi:non-specific serine/threonine protein kinase
VRDKHLDYFVKIAEEAEPHLYGPKQIEWLEKLEYERLNLRFALEWSLESPTGALPGLRLSAALARPWEVRSHLQLAREFYSKVLARPGAEGHTKVRADALAGAGRLAWCQDDNQAASEYFRAGLEIYKELGDRPNMGLLYGYLGFVKRSEGNMEGALKCFTECLAIAKETNDDRLVAIGQSGMGTLAADNGELEKARELKEKSLALYHKFGDAYVTGLLSWSLSRVVTLLKDFKAARTLLEECVTINRTLGNKWTALYYLEGFGDVAIGEGDAALCAKLYGTAEVLREKLGLLMPPTDRIFYDRAVQRMKESLEADAFKSAWEEGRGMKFEQALACALAKPAA